MSFIISRSYGMALENYCVRVRASKASWPNGWLVGWLVGWLNVTKFCGDQKSSGSLWPVFHTFYGTIGYDRLHFMPLLLLSYSSYFFATYVSSTSSTCHVNSFTITYSSTLPFSSNTYTSSAPLFSLLLLLLTFVHYQFYSFLLFLTFLLRYYFC